jgi:hypothetical protein
LATVLIVAGLNGLTEDRKQRLADLAHRQPEDEAGQDHAVELLGTPGINAQHGDRRKASGARYRDLDLPQFGQQMPSVEAVAPVGLVERGQPVEMLVNRLRHLAGQDGRQCPPAETAVVLTPLQALRSHAFHQFECAR